MALTEVLLHQLSSAAIVVAAAPPIIIVVGLAPQCVLPHQRRNARIQLSSATIVVGSAAAMSWDRAAAATHLLHQVPWQTSYIQVASTLEVISVV